MKVIYKNEGAPVVNEVWRELYCYAGKHYTTEGRLIYQREIMDAAGGTVYICVDCVENGTAAKELKKHGLKL